MRSAINETRSMNTTGDAARTSGQALRDRVTVPLEAETTDKSPMSSARERPAFSATIQHGDCRCGHRSDAHCPTATINCCATLISDAAVPGAGQSRRTARPSGRIHTRSRPSGGVVIAFSGGEFGGNVLQPPVHYGPGCAVASARQARALRCSNASQLSSDDGGRLSQCNRPTRSHRASPEASPVRHASIRRATRPPEYPVRDPRTAAPVRGSPTRARR